MNSKIIVIWITLILIAGCKTNIQMPINYLALGDSYTIGESVNPMFRWPVQLADDLTDKGFPVNKPKILAKTGWTTDELLAAMDTSYFKPPYDLVSVLIGVNNQYRGRDTANYREELEIVMERAVYLAGGKKERVFVVSIPDWGVMPFAIENGHDPDKVAGEIDLFNQVKKEVSDKKGLKFINITDISREASSKPEYIADDGLHPSGEMYTVWVQRILPFIKQIVSKEDTS
jgi:lysophospholipase L1-like esterase